MLSWVVSYFECSVGHVLQSGHKYSSYLIGVKKILIDKLHVDSYIPSQETTLDFDVAPAHVWITKLLHFCKLLLNQ